MKIIIHDKGSKTTIGNSEVAIKNIIKLQATTRNIPKHAEGKKKWKNWKNMPSSKLKIGHTLHNSLKH